MPEPRWGESRVSSQGEATTPSLHIPPEERPLSGWTRLESPTLDGRTTVGRPQTQGLLWAQVAVRKGQDPPHSGKASETHVQTLKKKKKQNKK